MHFIDDEDFVLRRGWFELCVFNNVFAYVIHPGLGSRINFNNVDTAPGRNFGARSASVARFGTALGAGLAVDRFTEQAGGGKGGYPRRATQLLGFPLS
jgi:hypothetical protein